MEKDCSYYFLSETAKEIWRENNEAGQNQMFTCLTREYKESFYRRVIFRSEGIRDYEMREIAENAFLSTWEIFNTNGKAGKISIAGISYIEFFFTIFKRQYLKDLQRKLKEISIEKEYGATGFAENYDSEIDESLSLNAQKALEKLGPNCRQLLIWKHIDGLSYDEIAKLKNYDRNSSIKELSRCRRNFTEMFRNIK